MHARLDDRLAPPLGGERRLHGDEDLGIGERQRLDVERVEIVDPDLLHRATLVHGGRGCNRRGADPGKEYGAGEGSRTPDIQLGKLTFYR